MGVYATVKSAVPCQRCHQGTVDNAQIKLGDCSQLPEYQVGERIRPAAGHAGRGEREDLADAVAVGYPNPCDYCGGFQLSTIVLLDQRIVAVRFRSLASYEDDVLLVGRERRGRGPFRHGTWTRIAPTAIAPLRRGLQRLDWPQDPLPRVLQWLIAGWLGDAVLFDAQRDADGRLEVYFSLGGAPMPTGFPPALAERLSRGRLPAAELKRWDFLCARETAQPPSLYEPGIPADSPHAAVYRSALSAALCSYW